MLRPISKFSRKLDCLISDGNLVLSISVNGLIGEGENFLVSSLPYNEFYSISDDDSWLQSLNPPLLAVEDESSYIFHRIQVREESEMDFILQIPLSKREIISRRKSTGNLQYPFSNLKLRHNITFNSPETWMEYGGITQLSGRIHFRSFAGVMRFLFAEDVTSDHIEIEVVSYKLNYAEDFRVLLSELAEFHSELILKLDEPTEISLASKQVEEVSNQVVLLHLRKLMEDDQLPAAIETILSNPQSRTIHELHWDDPSQINNVDMIELQQNFMDVTWRRGGRFSRQTCGFSPEMLPEGRTSSTVDTNENRFIKFCLQELEFLVYKLKCNLNKKKYEPSYTFLEACERLLEAYIQHPFFREVGSFMHLSNSMVMQRRNGYKEILTYMQRFELGIQLESEINEFESVWGDLRPIHQLYEYWCFFKLVQILEEICGENPDIGSHLLQRTDRGFVLNLKQKVECNVPFRYNNMEIFLYYNRDFKKYLSGQWNGSYDGAVYHPDFSMKLKYGEEIHWLHFDSKYKIDYKKLQSMLDQDRDEGAYKQNDIHTAHAYRDAILGSRGVYILYPDNIILSDKLIFVRQPNEDYPYLIPSIGAFPLRPGNKSEEQVSSIVEYLIEVFNAICEGSTYNEETGFSF
ncbi:MULTISPECIES: DUF2357 domain-containing protein [Bacillales]|uniref:DUF2357 domain-containing protein n=1 Tax=Bacillales TaxID=1385 RepID=UPI000346B3B9|nr:MULTISPECIES: DUF2357 domain-containing protein [Bacillales]KMZ43540.1 hypothetical protein AC624_22070 [Bacillus sp. FJAT-27238]